MLKATHDKLVAEIKQDYKDAEARKDIPEINACVRALKTLQVIRLGGFTDGNSNKQPANATD